MSFDSICMVVDVFCMEVLSHLGFVERITSSVENYYIECGELLHRVCRTITSSVENCQNNSSIGPSTI